MKNCPDLNISTHTACKHIYSYTYLAGKKLTLDHISGQQLCKTYKAVQTNGGIVDVVVGSNHAQVERRHVHVIFHTDTLQTPQMYSA